MMPTNIKRDSGLEDVFSGYNAQDVDSSNRIEVIGSRFVKDLFNSDED